MNDTTSYLIVSAVSALFLGLLKVLYESKCKKVTCCCGLVDVERDTETEFKEDQIKAAQSQHQGNKSSDIIPSLTNIV